MVFLKYWYFQPSPLLPVCGVQVCIPNGNAVVGYVLPLVSSCLELVPCRVFTYCTRSGCCANATLRSNTNAIRIVFSFMFVWFSLITYLRGSIFGLKRFSIPII